LLGICCIIFGHFGKIEKNPFFRDNKNTNVLNCFSATMVVPKSQDLPPPGGYSKIPFARVPARTLFNGYQIIGGYIGKKIHLAAIFVA
jgi:GRIM-19 protein